MRVVGDPDVGGVFLGGRTQTTAPGGKYGLFYTALPRGETPTDTAWLYGLQQNAENRANLALVNTGEVDGSSDAFTVTIYDGKTGNQAGSFSLTLPPKRWTQFSAFLTQYASSVSNAYVKVVRTSGNNPFVAYGVVNDGGAPGQRTDDGAYIAMRR